MFAFHRRNFSFFLSCFHIGKPQWYVRRFGLRRCGQRTSKFFDSSYIEINNIFTISRRALSVLRQCMKKIFDSALSKFDQKFREKLMCLGISSMNAFWKCGPRVCITNSILNFWIERYAIFVGSDGFRIYLYALVITRFAEFVELWLAVVFERPDKNIVCISWKLCIFTY